MRIYVSFPPHTPKEYAEGNRSSWHQITHFVYNAIYNKFPNLAVYTHNIDLKEEDILITCAPNPLLQKFPHRSILVDNDNFEVGKWKYGKFKKYGINAETPHGYPFNYLLVGLHGALLKTNDVAINKWNNNHEDILEKKNFLIENIKNVYITPHPIDKNYFGSFYDPALRLKTLKILIYNNPPLKNAAQLADLVIKHFDKSCYDIIYRMNKTEPAVRNILQKYAYLGHVSYSEGFPYFANEFLCQGLPLFGHEEWWDPKGFDILKWTYDPTRQDGNLQKLKKLLSSNFIDEYHIMRQNLVQSHLDRTDNNWNVFTNKLIEMIEVLL